MNGLSRARCKIAKLRTRLDGKAGYRRPRGANRIGIAMRLELAVMEAHALYIDRLRGYTDRSGARRMPSCKGR